MQYKFVGFVENNFVGKPTFLFSTFPTILFSLLQFAGVSTHNIGKDVPTDYLRRHTMIYSSSFSETVRNPVFSYILTA